ncbi:hypothetical protein KM043_012725 [Ampulex compressa]|nr:hypothetical protein KM043_012725 [Ampulex compressa]
MYVYGKWTKNELLGLLIQRLISNVPTQPTTSKSIRSLNKDRSLKEKLNSIIHSGMYNEYILSELQKKDMSPYVILKVMKHGLRSLTPDTLKFFKEFNVNLDTLESNYIRTDNLNDRLIMNLRAIGIAEPECWNIIIHGLTSQNECVLYKLFLSGIDVPGILNWQTSLNQTEKAMLDFLRYIGIKEYIIELVAEYGVDDETRNMLYDLGYNDKDVEYLNAQDIFSEHSLIILESDASKSDDTYDNTKNYDLTKVEDGGTPVSRETQDIDSAYSNDLYCFKQFTCACHTNSDQKTAKAELSAQRNDYLRQNVMVPLAWAMSRALNYNPSDPTYYIAFQLLRWKYGNIPQAEKENAHRIVALATIAKDKQVFA